MCVCVYICVCVFAKCACMCARVYLKNSRGARGVKLFEAFSKAEPNQLLVNLAWLGLNGASSLCERDADRHCQSRKREKESERGAQQQFQLFAKVKHKRRQEKIHPND